MGDVHWKTLYQDQAAVEVMLLIKELMSNKSHQFRILQGRGFSSREVYSCVRSSKIGRFILVDISAFQFVQVIPLSFFFGSFILVTNIINYQLKRVIPELILKWLCR